MRSIKTKIIASIIACTLLAAIPISILGIRDVGQVSKQSAGTELSLICENKQSLIDAQISKIEQSVDTLSSIAMERMDFQKFKTNSAYVKQYTDSIMDDVVKFGERTEQSAFMCAIIRISRNLLPVSFLPEIIPKKPLPAPPLQILPCMNLRIWLM